MVKIKDYISLQKSGEGTCPPVPYSTLAHGSNPTEGKICFSHFTLLEWNVKNCFVKLIKTLKNAINVLVCSGSVQKGLFRNR